MNKYWSQVTKKGPLASCGGAERGASSPERKLLNPGEEEPELGVRAGWDLGALEPVGPARLADDRCLGTERGRAAANSLYHSPRWKRWGWGMETGEKLGAVLGTLCLRCLSDIKCSELGLILSHNFHLI